MTEAEAARFAKARKRARNATNRRQQQLDRQKTEPPAERAGGEVVVLPFLTPLANQWQRMHYRTRRRVMDQIAACLALQKPSLVNRMLPKAHVKIVRRTAVSAASMDRDGLQFVKPILDALQPASKRHPYGIGAIANDTIECLTYEVIMERAPPGGGCVRIEVSPQ